MREPQVESVSHGPSGIVAFLFTDIAGSTRLWERLPAAMTQALERHDAILRSSIEDARGHVVKTTGDGMMAVFPTAADGVAASLAAQRALADAAWGETGRLKVRMGLHAGVAEQRGTDYFGPTINRTARLMAAGHGGQVLLSAAAASLAADQLPDGAALRDLGEYRLKDLGRPERVYQLTHPSLEGTFGPLVTLDHGGGTLPTPAAPFIGRRTELLEIGHGLEGGAVRLLTLTGPGGTGKTSLAIRAAAEQADRFRDGVSFVDLSATRDTASVLLALARVIGLGEDLDRPIADELTDRLRDRHMLIVLDNFEQVTEAAGAIVRLLDDCPEITFLVTSRESLRVRAESVYPVPPLGLPPSGSSRISAAELEGFEAVQLFVERARAVRPDFRLTDDSAAAVADICRRLDGLPLAIELAAARLRLFSAEALRDRLGSRLELLRSATRDLPARQQTLRATIDWSYQLLQPDEQRLFETLAVFADADIAAVEAVMSAIASSPGDAIDAIDGVASLLDKSLIRQIEAAGAEPRLRMLETIREYAAERLREHPERHVAACRAHATYYAGFVERRRRDLVGAARDHALAEMAGEVENLRVAWRFWVDEAVLEPLTKLADGLLILNEARGWYQDTVALTTDLLNVLAATTSTPELIDLEIALRTSLARALMATRGYTAEVADEYAHVLELFEGRDAPRQQFSALRGLASLYMLRTEFSKGRRLGEQILELAERENDPGMRIDGQLVVGATLAFDGHLRDGLEYLDAAIDAFDVVAIHPPGFRQGNDPRVACLTTSGFVLWLLGFPDRAVARADAAIALAARLDHPFTSAYAQFHSGLLHWWRREPEIVLERATRLLEIADRHDLRIWSVLGGCLLGVAQVALGQHASGLVAVRTGIADYSSLRAPAVFIPMLLSLDAAASGLAGRPDEALAPVDRAIELVGSETGSVALPEIYLLKGDLLVALADRDGEVVAGAERWYQLAIDRSVVLEAGMSGLRAATRLSRISPEGPARDAAVRELERRLEAFTEGFETADLIDARAAIEVGRHV